MTLALSEDLAKGYVLLLQQVASMTVVPEITRGHLQPPPRRNGTPNLVSAQVNFHLSLIADPDLQPTLASSGPRADLELVGLQQGGPVAPRDQLLHLLPRQVYPVVEVAAPQHEVVREHGPVLPGSGQVTTGRANVQIPKKHHRQSPILGRSLKIENGES